MFKPTAKIKNSLGEIVPIWVPLFMVDDVTDIADCDCYIETDPSGIESVRGDLQAALEKYSVWASVLPVSGREYTENMKIRDEMTYKISMRYIPGLKANMKILYSDKIFDIVSVINFAERNEEIELVCTEVDNNGKC